jgi:hypothetical protein
MLRSLALGSPSAHPASAQDGPHQVYLHAYSPWRPQRQRSVTVPSSRKIAISCLVARRPQKDAYLPRAGRQLARPAPAYRHHRARAQAPGGAAAPSGNRPGAFRHRAGLQHASVKMGPIPLASFRLATQMDHGTRHARPGMSCCGSGRTRSSGSSLGPNLLDAPAPHISPRRPATVSQRSRHNWSACRWTPGSCTTKSS